MKLVTSTIPQSLRANTVGAQDARYITELNAVYPRVYCSETFGAGDGVWTALLAATAVRPLQLEARCIAASQHFAVPDFHIN